jgi:Ca2+-binding EF-hand superfamily protein
MHPERNNLASPSSVQQVLHFGKTIDRRISLEFRLAPPPSASADRRLLLSSQGPLNGEMGNTKSISISSDSPVTLAMMAVAMNFELKRVQLIALRNAMAGFSDERGMVDREGFEKALELANLSSVEIFDLLFTMWDNAGNDQVPFKDFCVGISPMACPHDDVHAILRFSLRVSDDDNRGSVMLDDLRRLLSCT